MLILQNFQVAMDPTHKGKFFELSKMSFLLAELAKEAANIIANNMIEK